MKIWSRGLGKRELVMDLSRCTFTRDGDNYVLTGTVVEPVNWEFRITMTPQDVPGLIQTAMTPGFIAIGIQWLRRTLRRPLVGLRNGGACWTRNPGCGTGKEEDCRFCPAYQTPAPCWALRWEPLMQTMEPSRRDKWRAVMTEKCPQCPVYTRHREEIDAARRLIG